MDHNRTSADEIDTGEQGMTSERRPWTPPKVMPAKIEATTAKPPSAIESSPSFGPS